MSCASALALRPPQERITHGVCARNRTTMQESHDTLGSGGGVSKRSVDTSTGGTKMEKHSYKCEHCLLRVPEVRGNFIHLCRPVNDKREEPSRQGRTEQPDGEFLVRFAVWSTCHVNKSVALPLPSWTQRHAMDKRVRSPSVTENARLKNRRGKATTKMPQGN